jgi:hypothetical protein
MTALEDWLKLVQPGDDFSTLSALAHFFHNATESDIRALAECNDIVAEDKRARKIATVLVCNYFARRNLACKLKPEKLLYNCDFEIEAETTAKALERYGIYVSPEILAGVYND